MSPADHVRRRARLLLTLLAYTHTRFPRDHTPALVGALRAWLGTWSGVGRVIEGMMRLGYDVQLTRYGDQGWRASSMLPASRIADGGRGLGVCADALARGASRRATNADAGG